MRKLFAAVAAVGLLTACGGSKPGGGATGSTQPASTQQSSTQAQQSSKGPTGTGATTVTVKNFAFHPGNLTVDKGAKVTWKFEDSTDHNVTSDDNTFKSKDLKSGGTYSYTFNKPGKYSYICSIHQYMKGTVTVK